MIEKIQLFEGSPTMGIKIYKKPTQKQGNSSSTWEIFAFCNKKLKILEISIESETKTLKIHEILSFSSKDWIMSVSNYNNANETFLLGTIHAEVLEISKKTGTILTQKRNKNSSNLQRLLYSMEIFVLDHKINEENTQTAIIACGTGMGDIFMWNFESEKNIWNHSQNGSIFGISISKDGKLLSSCSDDRIVKVFTFEKPIHQYITSSKLENEEKDQQLIPITAYNVVDLFGHKARVWKSRFLEKNGYQLLFSCGEDATICGFDCRSGAILASFKGHQKKNVWDVCLSENGEMLASGGADGNVKLWETKNVFLNLENHHKTTIAIPNISELHNSPNSSELKQSLTPKIRIIDSNGFENKKTLYFVTNDERLFKIHDILKLNDTIQEESAVNSILKKEILQKYLKISCFFVSEEFFGFGTDKGSILLIFFGQNTAISHHFHITLPQKEKIFKLQVVNAKHFQFLAFNTNSVFYLGPETKNENPGMQVLAQFKMKNCPTTAIQARINEKFDEETKIFLIGDFKGRIHAFITKKQEENCSLIIEPSFSSNFHSKKSKICCMKQAIDEKIEDTEKNLLTIQIYSVSSSGDFMKIGLTVSHDKICTKIDDMSLIEENNLKNIVPNLEKIEIFGKKIYLLGFYGHNFVVFDWTEKSRILSHDCGCSGNLQHSISTFYSNSKKSMYFMGNFLEVHQNSSQIIDTVWKKSKNSQNSNGCTAGNSLNHNFSGRTIYDVQCFVTKSSNLVCAGEDTSIYLLNLNNSSQYSANFETKIKIQKHECPIRAIRTLESSKFGDFFFCAGGKEEISCWRVSECQKEAEMLMYTVISEDFATIFHSDTTQSSKIWKIGQNMKNTRPKKQKKLEKTLVHYRTFAIETFILKENENAVVFGVVTGSSDSVLKVFVVILQFENLEKKQKLQSAKIIPVAKIEAEDEEFFGPILSLKYFKGPEKLQHYVSFGTSNGFVKIIELSNCFDEVFDENLESLGNAGETLHNLNKNLKFSKKIHQVGANSIDVFSNSDKIHLVSGSDDQSISILELSTTSTEKDAQFSILNEQIIDNYTSSSIVSVKFLEDCFVLAMANDSRMFVFENFMNQQNLLYKMVYSTVLELSDVQKVCCVKKEEQGAWIVHVVGQGIESFELNLNKISSNQ